MALSRILEKQGKIEMGQLLMNFAFEYRNYFTDFESIRHNIKRKGDVTDLRKGRCR